MEIHLLFFGLKAKIKAEKTSFNVPAVCDGLAARIRKCVAFPGPKKCGWRLAWEWSAAE
jgi:hypothetical protein